MTDNVIKFKNITSDPEVNETINTMLDIAEETTEFAMVIVYKDNKLYFGSDFPEDEEKPVLEETLKHYKKIDRTLH